MKLKFHNFEFLMRASPEAVFCHLKTVTSKQGENQNVQDCTLNTTPLYLRWLL
jgi:hypothetical protein